MNKAQRILEKISQRLKPYRSKLVIGFCAGMLLITIPVTKLVDEKEIGKLEEMSLFFGIFLVFWTFFLFQNSFFIRNSKFSLRYFPTFSHIGWYIQLAFDFIAFCFLVVFTVVGAFKVL